MKVFECLGIPVHIMALKHPKGHGTKKMDKGKKEILIWETIFLLGFLFELKLLIRRVESLGQLRK